MYIFNSASEEYDGRASILYAARTSLGVPVASSVPSLEKGGGRDRAPSLTVLKLDRFNTVGHARFFWHPMAGDFDASGLRQLFELH